jgi:hypothetical protein
MLIGSNTFQLLCGVNLELDTTSGVIGVLGTYIFNYFFILIARLTAALVSGT